MILTGFADEAAPDIDGQIRATLELGWRHIEARSVDDKNICDISNADFDRVCRQLDAAGIGVYCFGSGIANWGTSILDPPDSSLAEAKRAIPRMKRLGTKLVRIMSFAVLKDCGPDDQMEAERFRRLRDLTKMFLDAGLIPAHENCMNYGGMGWTYTLRLLENVPGLKLVFDTGNPVNTLDMTKTPPYPRQSAWEFYSHVKEHVVHVHVKDGVWDDRLGKCVWTFPGEGQGDVRRIAEDLLRRGYDGAFSIEPHMTVVFHEHATPARKAEAMYRNYVEYGKRMERILNEIKAGRSARSG